MLSEKCKVWSVKCTGYKAQCGVQSIKCKVWSIECGV